MVLLSAAQWEAKGSVLVSSRGCQGVPGIIAPTDWSAGNWGKEFKGGGCQGQQRSRRRAVTIARWTLERE